MLKITCIIVVRNEILRLPKVLESIAVQDYDHRFVQKLVVDGRSTDGTPELARLHGCEVLVNKMVRAEPGVALGLKHASGDVVIVLAADNRLYGANFFSEIVKPFEEHPSVQACMPLVVSTAEDSFAIRYVNQFSDPFNHFLYWDAVSPWTFSYYYPKKYENESYVIYDFANRDMPMLALAQGMAVRSRIERDPRLDEDDMAPIIESIDKGYDVACMKRARVEHHTAINGRHFIEKFRPRFRDRLTARNRPIWSRSARLSGAQRMRAIVWPFYAISFVLPLCVSIYRFFRDREQAWLTHAPFSFAFCAMMWRVAVEELIGGRVFHITERPFPEPHQ